MSDGQALYAAAAGLTLAECLFWVRAGGAAFLRAGRYWSTLLPSRLLGNARGGLGIVFPFPLGSRLFLTHPLSLSFSSRGVVNGTLEGAGGEEPPLPSRLRFLPWAEARTVTRQGALLLSGGQPFLSCPSAAQAEMLAEALAGAGDVPALPPSHFSLPEARELLALAEGAARPLRWLGSAQFLLLFLLAPLLTLWGGAHFLGWALGAAVLLDLVLAVLLFRAHARIFPTSRGERAMQAAGVALFPPMAVRSADILCRHALGAFHPLVAARLLLPEERFRRFAERTARGFAAVPRSSEEGPMGKELEEHRGRVKGEVRRFLEGEGFPWEELLAPPPPQVGTAAYCPRCHAQFTSAEGPCSDCGHPQRLPHGPINRP